MRRSRRSSARTPTAIVPCGRPKARPRFAPWWRQPASRPARAPSEPCSARSRPDHCRSPLSTPWVITGKILVVGFDQGPLRNLGAGPVDHVTHGPLVSLPLVPVAPVLVRNLEPFEPGLLALFEPPQLLVLADIQPELHHHAAVADQLLFKVVDFAISPPPVSLGAEAFHALNQNPPIPGPIKDRHQPMSRDVAPEPPEVGLRAFLIGGRGRGHDVVLT